MVAWEDRDHLVGVTATAKATAALTITAGGIELLALTTPAAIAAEMVNVGITKGVALVRPGTVAAAHALNKAPVAQALRAALTAKDVRDRAGAEVLVVVAVVGARGGEGLEGMARVATTRVPRQIAANARMVVVVVKAALPPRAAVVVQGEEGSAQAAQSKKGSLRTISRPSARQ